MTLLALRFSRYANGVAMQHGKVSREMFPQFSVDSITNGVHAVSYTHLQFLIRAPHMTCTWLLYNCRSRGLRPRTQAKIKLRTR